VNTNNIILSTLASAFIAYAMAMLGKNDVIAVVSAIIGIVAWVGYDYLP
jgi:hypothetical protein